MAIAADILPVQPAPRPDAPARKPEVETAQAEDGKSFADALGAEVDAAPANEAVPARPAQPAPATIAIAAPRKIALASIAIVSAGALKPDAAIAEPDIAAAPTAIKPDVSAIVAIAPNMVVAPAPVVPATAVVTAPADIPIAAVANAAVAAAAPVLANAAAPAKRAAPETDTPKTDAPKAARPEAAAPEAKIDADPAAIAPAAEATVDAQAAQPVAAESAIAIPVALAIAVPIATAIAVPVATPVAKAVPQISEAAPGNRRAAERTDATIAPDAATPAAKPASSAAGVPASAAATPTQAAANHATAQAQAAAADAATPDLKIDTAAASSTASTSVADALTARATSGQPGQTAAPHPALQSAPAAAVQVYTRFIERFDGRAQRFEVSLEPAELGRVDVRIEIGADKKVHAVLAAHDSAALTDLMRGQRSLERALSDAGIDLADKGLRFELSDNSGRNLARQQQDSQASSDLAHAWRSFSTVDVPVEASITDIASASRSYGRRSSRLDLVA